MSELITVDEIKNLCLLPEDSDIHIQNLENLGYALEAELETKTKQAEEAERKLKIAVEFIEKTYKAETARMFETCPDCWSDDLGCSREKGCAQYTQKGLETPFQKGIKEALAKIKEEQ